MSPDSTQTLEHLFRHESGKLVSVLTKIFGPHNLELAEDVVQDTLLKALERWKYGGIPDNPSAWLFTAARNKALDVLRRDKYHKEFAAEISPLLKSEYSVRPTLENLVTEDQIEDEQLQMMFVCCHPSVSEEGQVALILKTLCGFSVGEIAKAFLTSEETITKRLYRAREQFREKKVEFELPSPTELQSRLDNVLTAVYLIFNEGYSSSYHDSLVREDLVEESLRLGKMLADHPLTNRPESLALLALMCFQSARIPARLDKDGKLVQLKDQDRALWSKDMVALGIKYLEDASVGDKISPYHLEAAIAHEHCVAKSYSGTDWKKILKLYDWLLEIKPDALVALNRLIVFGEVNGPAAALKEIEKLANLERMQSYYLYPAVLGEWHAQLGKHDDARKYFERAIELTHSAAEKQLLMGKMDKLRS
ncbi:MAG TPA: sigma-70 family RNA polymerase sigma factor [Cyclobacteriaceae bacterium]|nr:sigma-70 family RNA polymerase sigma factor [Cyclobacteriaceae bacterium]